MEVLIIVLLMVVNGVFALTEMALVSARKSRLQTRADDGDAGAKLALDLAENPARALSTIQIGITLVGIFAGAFGGSAIVGPLSENIAERVPSLADSAEAIAVGLVVGMTTYLSLVVGELVPKKIALQNAESIAATMARPLLWLSRLVRPLVWVLETSTTFIIRLLRIRPTEDDVITQSEIIALVRQGVDVGVFDEDEEDMVRNVMHLDEQRIGSFVTPRIDIVTISLDMSIGAIRQILTQTPFTTYPVVDSDFDSVRGIVGTKSLIPYLISGESIPLTDMMVQPLFVPENMTAANLLTQFKQSGIHTAIVIDEYGSHIGLIRLHDIMEQIVGEVDGGEFDENEADITRRADGSYLIDGLVAVEKLETLYEGFHLPEDERGRYATLAGFIMERLGRVPVTADTFAFGGLVFEVVDMDGAHMDKVLVKAHD